MAETNLYKQLSEERKKMQAEGTMPEWYTTAGWQMFKSKYLYDASTVKEQFERIASTAAKHLAKVGMEQEAYDKFFELLWKGWLSPSTPVLANMGTTRGLPVSCSGGYIQDSVEGFYRHNLESAVLTKHGFGTSGYMGDVRPRGSKIAVGGKASGVLPVFKMLVQTTRDIAQGTARRGAWAGYLPLDHGDFDELCDYVQANPDDANVGWNVSNEVIEKLENQDPEMIRRFKKSLKLKMVSGKGYYNFIDKANEQNPMMYKANNLKVKASNLCNEIFLHSDENHSFTCVLSSMNISKYDEWKDTDAVYWATIFLDCVAEEFITRASTISGLEAAVRSTIKGRALGLGVLGLHTYLQSKMIPFESLEAQFFNKSLFQKIRDDATVASKKLAELLGEPEWCKGFGVRNTHLMAIAPTKSTGILIGNVSEGINPDPAMTFTQMTAAGEIERINPVLVNLMKQKNIYTKRNIQDVIDADGSVQNVDWLNDEEKSVFKTAFEINQEVILRLASQRQPFIDQGQSLNLFFSAGEDETWISHIHRLAFLDKNIKGLYYIYSKVGVKGSTDCVACQ